MTDLAALILEVQARIDAEGCGPEWAAGTSLDHRIIKALEEALSRLTAPPSPISSHQDGDAADMIAAGLNDILAAFHSGQFGQREVWEQHLRGAISRLTLAPPGATTENAKVELEKRAWELIDLLAVFFGDSINPRTWHHLLVYAPKKPPSEEIAGLIGHLEDQVNCLEQKHFWKEAANDRKSIAALCVLAAENERLKAEGQQELRNNAEGYRRRIRELQAELAQWQSKGEMADAIVTRLMSDPAAIRAKTIEECDEALRAAGYPIDHLARETIRARTQPEKKE